MDDATTLMDSYPIFLAFSSQAVRPRALASPEKHPPHPEQPQFWLGAAVLSVSGSETVAADALYRWCHGCSPSSAMI